MKVLRDKQGRELVRVSETDKQVRLRELASGDELRMGKVQAKRLQVVGHSVPALYPTVYSQQREVKRRGAF